MATYAANDLTLSLEVEATYGTKETTTAYDVIRFNSESLKGNAASTRSEEVNAERMTTDIVRTDKGAGGGVTGELSFGDWDELIQYALQAAAAPAGTHQQTGCVVSSSNQITHNDLTAANGYAAARWIKVSGATNAADNGVFRIKTQTDGTPSILVAAGRATSGSGNCQVDLMNYIENGTTLSFFTLLKYLEGGSDPDIYTSYAGSAVQSMTVSGERGGLITISFEFISKEEVSEGASHPSSGGNNTVGTAPKFSSVGDFSVVVENDSLTKTDIRSFSFTITNNLRAQTVMGTEGAIGVGNGSVTLEGSYRKYFESSTLLDKFLNNTTSQFGVGLQDSNGDCIAFDAHAIKYTDAQHVAGGKDTDMVMELSFEGFKDPTTGKMFAFHTVT